MMIDTTFKSSYHLEVGGDLGVASKVYYFPGANRDGGRDGVLVEIFNSNGGNWTGIFAFGTFLASHTGVYQLPNENQFCVVSKGVGYIVCANDPNDWHEISLFPILDVRYSVKHGIVMFANHTKLVAYGCMGLRWATGRLSWDDLRIKYVSESELVAEYWNLRDEAVRELRVNLEDGTVTGAAHFD